MSPGVLVATSEVYRTTSTVILGNDGCCLLVDPGVTALEVAGLLDAVEAHGWVVLAVWSTHPHWDHLLTEPRLARTARWGAPVPAERVPDHALLVAERLADDELARVLAERPDDAAAEIAGVPERFPTPADAPGVLDWPGPRVEVLTHRAHSPAHTALHVVGASVLVAGDMLSDAEIPLLDLAADDPVADHRSALALLAGTGARVVVPGHGAVGTDLAARVAADVAYLDGLERGEAEDRRLDAPWLRAEHDRQLARVRP